MRFVRCNCTGHSPYWEGSTDLAKEWPAFYETRKFTTVLTTACHWYLSWARIAHSTKYHAVSSLWTILLSSRLRLEHPNGLFSSGFPTKPLFAFLLSPHRCHVAAHLILTDSPTLLIYGEVHKPCSSSLWTSSSPFLFPPCQGQIFSKHPVLIHHCYVNARDHVHAHTNYIYYYYYYYHYYHHCVSCHRPFLPGTSLEPAVIPTAQASSFTLQHFPYYVLCSKYSCLL